MITWAQLTKSSVAVAASTPLWLPALPEDIALVAISGLCGGLSRWIAVRERLWPNGLSSVVLGLLAAVFLWPLGAPWLAPALGRIEMDPTTAVMFGGYVTGLMGLTIITFIIDFTSKRAKEVGDASSDK